MKNNKVSRRSFLKFISGVSLAGVFTKLRLFFPEMDSALAKSEDPNILGKVSIQKSREVGGEEKKQLLDHAVGSKDGRNVLHSDQSKLKYAEANVVIHTLSDGNSLTAVGIPGTDKKSIFVWYAFAKPVVENKTNGGRLSTQAGFYTVEDDDRTVSAISLSVNEIAADLNKPSTALSDPCGGCVSPIYGPWSYYARYCDRYDLGCMARCCGACVVPCSVNLQACLVCIFIWCPLCAATCCTHSYPACTPCAL